MSEDASSSKTVVAAGSVGETKFQNRTLQIFLHEMRATLEQNKEGEGGKGGQVEKILDDLEYVAQNMGSGRRKAERTVMVEDETDAAAAMVKKIGGVEVDVKQKQQLQQQLKDALER